MKFLPYQAMLDLGGFCFLISRSKIEGVQYNRGILSVQLRVCSNSDTLSVNMREDHLTTLPMNVLLSKEHTGLYLQL